MEKENIILANIEDEYKQSFLNYGTSVYADRAIPDVADGLKPVHRRIIYDMMMSLKLKSSGRYVKSARIVGDVIGQYHPHGDTSVYAAMVRMSQDFEMRYPLINGHGNFGNVDGDGAAAMRYTECKPGALMELIVDGIKENAVEMRPTFDEENLEPVVLPGLFPNILCNPTIGIAVGMASKFAPHNLGEVVDGTIAYINNKDIDTLGLMEYIKGPDFPLGGVITNQKDLVSAYRNGVTSKTIRIRGDYTVKGNKIIFTSLPYGVRKEKVRIKIDDLIKKGVFDTLLTDYSDDSAKGKIRIVFEMIEPGMEEEVLGHLFKDTPLESTFAFNQNALVNGVPKTLSLKQVIEEYVKHQIEVIIRTTIFKKEKAEARLHILEALLIALGDIDAVIALIKSSKNKAEAREKLKNKYSFDDIQANAILDMKLSKLSSLETDEIIQEKESILKDIKEYNSILNDEKAREEVLISKLLKMKKDFGDERRTTLSNIEPIKVVSKKDEIKDMPVKVTLSKNGDSLRIVKSAGMTGKTIDTRTTSILALFASDGMVYKVKVKDLKEVAKTVSELTKVAGIRILEIVDVANETDVLIVTKQGMIKRTKLSEFASPRKVLALKLRENDKIIGVSDYREFVKVTCSNDNQLIFSTKNITPTGRNGLGVRAMKFDEGDYLTEVKFLKTVDKTLVGKANTVGK